MLKKCAYFYLLIRLVVCYDIKVLTKLQQPYSPFYDITTNSLYCTELVPRLIHRYSFNEKRLYTASIEGNITTTFIIPVEGCRNRFIVADVLDVKIIIWNGRDRIAKVERIAFSIKHSHAYASTNWNVAKISPSCIFYGGTFQFTFCAKTPEENAALFYLKKSHQPKRLLKHMKNSAGIDWNVEKNLFYHIDPCDRILREFKWNARTGKIDHARIIYRFKNHGDESIVPLGLTIDTEGYLYATEYFGSVVLKINPRTCKVESRIKIPAEAVSAVTFGGLKNDILFVTTERIAFNATSGLLSNRQLMPGSGSIFMIKMPVPGYPARKFCSHCC